MTLADVERAARQIKGAIIETDFEKSRTLSEMFGSEIWLKFENLQFTESYKERGALNKLLSLAPAERARVVIAMYAGNLAVQPEDVAKMVVAVLTLPARADVTRFDIMPTRPVSPSGTR